MMSQQTTSTPTFSLATSNNNSSNGTESLDEILKNQFERCRQANILRNDPLEADVVRKSLPGTLELIAEYEPTLFGRKRPATVASTATVTINMDEPFNPEKFHFNKVGQEEVLVFIVGQGEKGDDENPHPILVNVSPLMYGHGLLIPWVKQGLPQQLTPNAVTLAVQLLHSAGSECECCIGFNSLGAFSSVNHLHLHIMYPGELDHQARLGGKAPLLDGRKNFPIAYAPSQSTVTNCYNNEGCQVELLDWMVPCFSFRQQKGNDAIVGAFESAVARFVRFLHRTKIPHNVLFLQDSHSGRVTIRVIIIPRKPQHHFDANQHGFNAALGEISGMLIAKTRHHFVAFEEAKVREIMARHVACEGKVMSDILAELKS